MTTKEMVAQIKKAREAFVDYMETTYKDKWDLWGEFEVFRTAGYLDGACERMLWLDNIYSNKKIKNHESTSESPRSGDVGVGSK